MRKSVDRYICSNIEDNENTGSSDAAYGSVHANRAEQDKATSEAIAFWKKLNGVELSREEVREIMENVTAFFDLLSGWESKN